MYINEKSKRNLEVNILGIRLSKVLIPYFLLSFLLIALILPVIFKTETGVAGTRDEVDFQLDQITAFTEQFPNLDLKNFHPSMTPLYHITLMFAAFIVGIDLIPLRFVSAFISLICLLIVYVYLLKRGRSPLRAFLFSLILLVSPYFFRPAIMLFTDDMALLFAFLSLMMLDVAIFDKRHFLWANIFILLTVLTRQVYAWLIGVSLLLSLQSQTNKRLGLNLNNAWPSILPIAGLAFFVILWGGLSPNSGSYSATINWDVPVYLVSLMGFYGVFLAPWYYRLYRENQNPRKVVYIISLVALAIVYLLVHPVSNEYFVIDRGGALWLLTTYLPIFLSSSILFWLLFPMGLIWLYITAEYLLLKRDYLMLIAFPLWFTANVANPRTYQRYYEPFLLFCIGYSLITLKPERWYEWLSLVVLPLLLLGMTFYQFFLPILFLK